MKIRRINEWQPLTLFFVLGGLLLVLSAGCGGDDMEISIQVNPEEVRPGEKADVRATIKTGPASLHGLRFNWEAKRGTIAPAPNAEPGLICTYIAPNTPGPDTITLQVVKGNKGITGQVKVSVSGVALVPVVPPGDNHSPRPHTPSPIFDVSVDFIPGGFMGDAEEVAVVAGVKKSKYVSVWPAFPDSRPGAAVDACYQWSYTPGPKAWAAVAWQHPELNFGGERGKNLNGYSRVTFWVKGERGGERLIFKAGGHTDPTLPHQASFREVGLGMSTLTREWKQWTIDLSHLPEGQDLSNVPCAFVWVAREMENPKGCTFYLDDIQYEK